MSEVTEGQPTVAQPRRRGRETSGDMVRSLLVVLALVFVVVALAVRPTPDSEVRRFDYSGVLAQAQDQARYDVLAPIGLPDTWRATSARTDSGDGAVTWHVGFVTPADAYAGLEQSDGDAGSFVDHLAADGRAAGTVTIGGATWRRVEGGDPEPRALVLRRDGVTTLVVGSASWAELRTLAASLQAS
jgi:hypothetical protein